MKMRSLIIYFYSTFFHPRGSILRRLAGHSHVGRSGRVSGKDRDQLVGDESELATCEHLWGKGAEQGVGLGVEVSEHLIRPPASQEADDVGVYSTTEESVGACGAKASGRDVRRKEAQSRA